MGLGNQKRQSKKPKGASTLQKAARIRNLSSQKENVAPAASSTPRLSKPPPKVKNYNHEYEKSQRKLRHGKTTIAKLRADLKHANALHTQTTQAEHKQAQKITELTLTIGNLVANTRETSAKGKGSQDLLRKKNKALQQRIQRSVKTLTQSVNRAKKHHFCRATEKGVYTIQARRLARIMVDSGCARAKVGPLMAQIGAVFGVHINREMSRRTVGRAIEEGGVAAKMQIAYELSLNEGVTISADSTSNRGLNIEASHLAARAPDYANGNVDTTPKSIPKVRFLGVEKTIDHTSAESVRGWNTRITEFIDVFNRSPLAKRLLRKLSVRDFLKILKGMNGDHASNEKSTAKRMQDLKHEASIEELGEQVLAGKTFMELVDYLSAWNLKKIAEAGGMDGWNALSPAEQSDRDAKLMKEVVVALGKDAYDALDSEDRRLLDLFVWGGCCMHKDLNSFKGGNCEMMLEWDKLAVFGPILLANKDNAALLRNLLDPAQRKDAILTEDQLRAFEASTRGGVKTCALAGAIFNNKDDKKGQADRHVDFMTVKLGKQHPRFPDTSNTRFGSHGDAAAELITYLPEYLEMLELIQWSKHNPSLTNIERNLLHALRDIPTLTELVAMTIYKMVITHPYLRQVRGPGTESTNLLDLGPLHREVCSHVQSILVDPDIIFGSNPSFESATLDGLEWNDTHAMAAVFKMIPSLPHVKEVTLAFFRGSLATWTRFSAEFAPGGIIDTCSAEEKELAWMPSTNDANEGALGAYRVAIRGKPSLTLHQYNSLAMYRRNDTQSFMDAVLTAEDHAYIMREARHIDASGSEAQRRREIVDFRTRTAEMQKTKAVAKSQKAAKVLQDNLTRSLIKLSNMETLTIPQIHDQLNAYRARGVQNMLANSKYPRKAEKLAALKAAFNAYVGRSDGVVVLDVPSHMPEVLPMIIEDWRDEEETEMEE
ncbi:hypothetical protein GGX14DRAFT_519404 [Mycena pura]|uniref:Uncharacterized protein n=1 Tax=Mycena pura TaxID=153505 RepID=A0AAD6VIT7_9AGAR|nr:hypothetical protein GGX14DRAFT_519404 [Mycena pura]